MLISRAVGIPYEGTELGIEYEIEGALLPARAVGWRRVNDGSLRGQPECAEYVTTARAKIEDASVLLETLHQRFADSELSPSSRCGVHIHLNATDFTVEEMTVWALVYYLFEPALLEYSGENRDHNLFCLSAKHATESLSLIHEMRRTGGWCPINSNMYKYAALNLGALPRHGTMEFRSLLTPADPRDILPWIQMLLAIRDYSRTMTDPSRILTALSMRGSWSLCQDVFTPEQLYLLGINENNAQDLLLPQARVIQSAAYCSWGEEAQGDRIATIARNSRAASQRGVPFWNHRVPADLLSDNAREGVQPRTGGHLWNVNTPLPQTVGFIHEDEIDPEEDFE